MKRRVFIAGATGYLGRALCQELLRRGHEVRALARPSAEAKVAEGCMAVAGDALTGDYAPQVAPSDTFVHLVGVSRPSPWKAREFRRVDLGSVEAAVRAALGAGVQHFIYVSVAHPAPVMRSYVAARAECEEIIRESGLHATILRPWYVLGPGHWWPYALLPLYRFAEHVTEWRESALRLGLVTHAQMIRALADSVETPVHGLRIVKVPEIRGGLRDTTLTAKFSC